MWDLYRSLHQNLKFKLKYRILTVCYASHIDITRDIVEETQKEFEL